MSLAPLVLAAVLAGARGFADEEAVFGPFALQIDGLASPAAAAIDADGRILIVEELGARVGVFDAAGRRVSSFGEQGSGDGELLDPMGLALGPDGEIFVADTGNDRVVVFDREGAFRRAFGRRGAGPGELCDPLGIAVDAERVLVADSGNDRIAVFDRDGTFRASFGGHGHEPGRFARPVDVALDQDGNAYVAEAESHRVQKLDREGRPLAAWGDFGPNAGQFSAPTGIDLQGDRVYVADRDNHRIQVFDLAGAQVDEWGLHALAPRQGSGRLHYPNQIAIEPSGRFALVVESFEDRCQTFARGTRPPLDVIDVRQGDSAPHFGERIDARGILCAVIEPARPSAIVFDRSMGESIEVTRLARHGRKTGQLLHPCDVALHPSRPELCVADAGTARLSVFRLDRKAGEALRYDPAMGRFVQSLDLALLGDPRLDTPWPVEPTALEYDRAGDLWVLDARSARVLRLDARLELLDVVDLPGVRGPTDLAFDRAGETLYVVDARARTVRAFDRHGAPRFSFGGPQESGSDEGGRFVRPFGVAAGRDGRVYVTDEGAASVHVFDESGAFQTRFGQAGLGRVELFKPKGLVQEGEHLLVLDFGNHRAQVLTPDGGFVEAFGARFFVMPTLAPVPSSSVPR